MSIFDFGAKQRNREKVTQEHIQNDFNNKMRNYRDDVRRDEHTLATDTLAAQKQNTENNLRFQEAELIRSYEANENRRQYEFAMANRAYNKSVAQAGAQLSFNEMAERAAMMQQDIKNHEDRLGVMFDENKTLLDFTANTTGLKMTRQGQLVQADFQEAKVETKFTGDIATFELERRKLRGDSQIQAQNAIVEGMKAAGKISATGSAGRSPARAALGVLAESGARQAAIANAFMFAEDGIDLGIAQLKDMLVLDQTMVIASRDKANNEYQFEDAKLTSNNKLDLQKIKASKASIKDRDMIVRKQIENARKQADLSARAAIMLKPEILPAFNDPREIYSMNDNPDTEFYAEMLNRPSYAEIPAFRPEPEQPDVDLGRENTSFTFGDAITIASTVAGGFGAATSAGMIGTTATATTASTFGGMTGAQWGTLSTTIGNMGKSYAR